MLTLRRRLVLAVSVSLVACGPAPAPVTDAGACTPGSATLEQLYSQHLASCASCHAGAAGGFTFTDARSFAAAALNVAATTKAGATRIVPRDPAASHLVFRIARETAPAARMPLGGAPLSAEAIEAISGWICAGAPLPATTDAGSDAGADAGLDAGTPDAGLSLISFAPQAGVAGTRVTLTGTGFSTTAADHTVTFAGVVGAVVSATANTLEADVPADAGTGLVAVTVFGRTVTSATPFTVIPGTPVPTVTALNPATLGVGAGPTTLTVDGTGFTATSVVKVDGAAVPTTFVSVSRLTAQLDAAVSASAGTRNITVSTTPADGGLGGGTSAAVPLGVRNPVPAVTALSPSTVASGGAAFTLSVTGTGFVASSGVEVDGAVVSTAFVSATALTAQLPSFSTAGARDIRVRNPGPGGGLSAAATLTVETIPLPSISTLSPNPGPASQSFTLTVTGANFTCTTPGPAVRLDSTSLTPTSCSATSLAVTVPATAAGALQVRVRNPNLDESAAVTLTLVTPNPAPALSSLSPAQVNAGSGAQTLQVLGTGFVASSTVRLDGVARTTTFVDATRLTVALLATDVATSGMRSVTVVTPAPGGGTSNALDLTVNFVNPVPQVSSLSPSAIAVGSGAQSVTVTGSNFVSGSTATLAGSSRPVTFVSPTQLQVALLAADVAATGTFALVVSNPAPGGGASNSTAVVVQNPAPQVTSLSPCGVVAGAAAFTLTLDGAGFLPSSTVTLAGTTLTAAFVSSTRLTVTVPAMAVATAPATRALLLQVSNAAPGGGPSNEATLGVAGQVRSHATHVQPIFGSACAGCHGGSGGLFLDTVASRGNLVGVSSSNCASLTRVVACGPLPSQSLLIDKLKAGIDGTPLVNGCGGPMPAQGSITRAEYESIVDWVAQGAPP